MRTGVDFLFKTMLTKIKMHAGLAIIIPAFFLIWVVIRQQKAIKKFAKRPTRFGFMFFESILFAAVFGLAVGFVTLIFLSSTNADLSNARVAALIVHLGSGVYEEVFFRLILISAIVFVLQRFFVMRAVPCFAVAIFCSSAIFAGCHYLPIFREPFEIKSFVFRVIAGVAFALLFVFRGVGITAYTHSLYNILLMFRLP